MIDDRTTHLNLPLPHSQNVMTDDVGRMRDAFSAIDSAIFGKQAQLSYSPQDAAQKGAPNGYAPLDSSAKVPAANLPSYVDDVLEYASPADFPGTGESGKIYISTSNGFTYRWTGSAYSQIVSSPGTTDSVAEGALNKYYTDARVKAAIAGILGNSISLDGNGRLYAHPSVITFYASGGETTLTFSPGGAKRFWSSCECMLNGVLLFGPSPSADFDLSGTPSGLYYPSLTFASPLKAGDRVIIYTND